MVWGASMVSSTAALESCGQEDQRGVDETVQMFESLKSCETVTTSECMKTCIIFNLCSKHIAPALHVR